MTPNQPVTAGLPMVSEFLLNNTDFSRSCRAAPNAFIHAKPEQDGAITKQFTSPHTNALIYD
jgi:hypothetical protein